MAMSPRISVPPTRLATRIKTIAEAAADKNTSRQPLHPHPRADRAEQLGVAPPKPVASAQPPVSELDRDESPIPDRRRREMLDQKLRVDHRRHGNAAERQHQVEHVRQPPRPDVDRRQRQQQPAHDACRRKHHGRRRQPGPQRDANGRQLNHRIGARDRRRAPPALAALRHPAHHRDKLQQAEPPSARRTGRWREVPRRARWRNAPRPPQSPTRSGVKPAPHRDLRVNVSALSGMSLPGLPADRHFRHSSRACNLHAWGVRRSRT